MKIIKPSFEILEQENDLEGIYKQIELASRICYKSEDKITETSAVDFVNRMIKSGHNAMLEHGTVYLSINQGYLNQNLFRQINKKYLMNEYSKVTKDKLNPHILCITTNYRVLVENGWMDGLKYMCKPTEFHEKRVTVKFIMDRIGSQSFCRHRVFSFAQESTRYCNYSKDKFGNELTFIQPCWLDDEALKRADSYNMALEEAEDKYLDLLENYLWTPQQARAVLPNSLKTELVMTGFISDWKHFFKLRDDSHAHPQAQELAKPLHEEFIKRGYIDG